MSRETQVVFCGVGGQGLISGGSLLAQAAILFENRYATLTSEYGTETRGTFTKSDVLISDEAVLFPEATNPDVVFAMAQVAYDRYVDKVGEGCVIVYDDSLVTEKPSRARQVHAPFTEIARDLGAVLTANTIGLGVIVGLVQPVKTEAVEQAIAETFCGKQKVQKLNLDAFHKGLDLARNL